MEEEWNGAGVERRRNGMDGGGMECRSSGMKRRRKEEEEGKKERERKREREREWKLEKRKNAGCRYAPQPGRRCGTCTASDVRVESPRSRRGP